jgi:hypothetical protein
VKSGGAVTIRTSTDFNHAGLNVGDVQGVRLP